MKPTALCVAIAAASMLPIAAAAETPDYFVEWVKPSAALYVDTGVKGDTGVKAELKATHVASGTYPVLLGSWNGDNKRFNLVMSHDEKARWEYGNNMQDFGNFTWYGGDFTVQVECTAAGAMSSTWTNNKGETITKTLDATAQYGILNDSNLNLYLFGSNLQGTPLQQHLGRLYYCRLWTDYEGTGTWTPARNLRPCVKNGVAGLYDSVNDEILYPGTGTLLAGPVAYDTIATWNGGAAPTAADLATASNWTCTDANGTAVASIVPDKATLVAFPGGVGSVTLPAGYVHTWGAVKVEGPVAHPVTMYGTCAAVRSNMVFLQNQYTLLGEGNVGDLNKIGGAQSAANYYRLQMRHDGWFYVNAAQAGTWSMDQDVDDYFGFYIDGRQVLFNQTFNANVNGRTYDVTEGWHRFTTIVGETGGGWGVEYKFGDDYVPFTITVNGATYILSDNSTFPKGSGESRITLTANADWSQFGTIALKSGTVIDLNGCQLAVQDIVADDYLGTAVTNSASKKAVLIFNGTPMDSKAYNDGIIKEVGTKIMLARAGELSATWTGAAGDGDALNANNWQDTLTDEAVVPTANHALSVVGTAVNLQIPSGSTFACKSIDIGRCTLTADCDWRGLSVKPTISGTANLDGHTLTLSNLSAVSGATFAGGEGSCVAFVPDEAAGHDTLSEAEYIDNLANLAFSGSVKILLRKAGGGGTLSANKMYLGNAHYAELAQADGSVSLGDSRTVIGGANSAAGRGIYRMSGGTLTCGSEFSVGGRGTGEFIQTGGTVTLNNWLNLGRNGGTGTYTITGGALENTYNNPVYVGAEGGIGIINVRGDASVNIYQLSMGGLSMGVFSTTGNKGYLNIDGNGTFTVRNWGTLGQQKNGYGEINQSGGTISFGAEFTVGEVGTGVYNLKAGALSVLNGRNLMVGRSAASTSNGTFTQSGGSVTCNDLWVGDGAGSTGLYTQNDGRIAPVFWEHIGRSGTGTYVQNGGTNYLHGKADNVISLGENASGVGRYVINGGLLDVETRIRIGKSGKAMFELNGGAVFAPTLLSEGGTATLLLNGGTLKATAAGAIIDGVADVQFNGGEFTLDSNGNDVSMANSTVTGATGPARLVKAGEGTLTVGTLPPVGTVKVAAGTLALTSGSTFERPLSLAHRWSFNGDYKDSVTGVAAEPTSTITFTEDGMARIPGGAKEENYIELGADKLPSDSVTMEFWATIRADVTWPKMFCLGNGTGSVIGFTFHRDRANGPSGIDVTDGGAVTGTGTLTKDVPYYFAFTFQANPDGSTTMKAYCVNTATGELVGTIDRALSGWRLTEKITQTMFRLGYSFWNDGAAQADYDEVRVWNGAISKEGALRSVALGPDAEFGEIELSQGGTLDLGGNTLTWPSIVCKGGTVQNGNLVVTDAVRLDVGDCISASGTIDLANAKVEVQDVENLRPFSFIVPVENETLNIVGTPKVENLPRGWRVSTSSNGARLDKSPIIIFIR